jgi:valyl-tRNA synthetase
VSVDASAPEKAMTAVVTGAELYLPLEGLINIEEELARLGKELEKWTKEVERVQKKLGNEKFVSKAPQSVVDEEKAKETDYLEKQAAVKERIKELKGE